MNVLLHDKLDNQVQVSFALGQVTERACINFVLGPKTNNVNGSEECYSDFKREANKGKKFCCSCQMGAWKCDNGRDQLGLYTCNERCLLECKNSQEQGMFSWELTTSMRTLTASIVPLRLLPSLESCSTVHQSGWKDLQNPCQCWKECNRDVQSWPQIAGAFSQFRSAHCTFFFLIEHTVGIPFAICWRLSCMHICSFNGTRHMVLCLKLFWNPTSSSAGNEVQQRTWSLFSTR